MSVGDSGVSVEGSAGGQWDVSRVSVRGSLRGSLGGRRFRRVSVGGSGGGQ